VQHPELKREQYQNQLNEYLNSTTLSFHQPNLNTMYYELHCHQRSREVHCMFLWQALLCLLLVLAWNLAIEPAERFNNTSVNQTLLMGFLTGVIATMTRMLKKCSKVKLWFWNVLMISLGLFLCFNILRGVDSVKSNLRNAGADGSLVPWGRVLFGYSVGLTLVNTVGVVVGCEFLLILTLEIALAVVVGFSISAAGHSNLIWVFVTFVACVHIAISYNHIRLQKLQALWRHWQNERLK